MVVNGDERLLRIKRLQHSLSTIRKIAGWTTEQMGEKIGVTKQTISNLENGKNSMNFSQYIALRTILDYEIETNTENEVLSKVITILLDSDEEEYIKYKGSMEIIAASAVGGVSGAALLGLFVKLVPMAGIGLAAGLAPIVGLGIASGIVSAAWLKNIVKNNQRRADNE